MSRSSRRPRRAPASQRAEARHEGRGVSPARQYRIVFGAGEEPVNHSVEAAVGANALEAILQAEADDARRDLMSWIEEHPGEWKTIEVIAFDLVDDALRKGRMPRISIGYIVEEIRRQGIRATNGDEFAINNNLKAAMARYLAELHPEWESFIERRRSKCDRAFKCAEKGR